MIERNIFYISYKQDWTWTREDITAMNKIFISTETAIRAFVFHWIHHHDRQGKKIFEVTKELLFGDDYCRKGQSLFEHNSMKMKMIMKYGEVDWHSMMEWRFQNEIELNFVEIDQSLWA